MFLSLKTSVKSRPRAKYIVITIKYKQIVELTKQAKHTGNNNLLSYCKSWNKDDKNVNNFKIFGLGK